MPFSSVDSLPSNIKKLPAKKQRQWMSVFNGAFKRAKDSGKSTKEAESSAFAQANGVVKKSINEDGWVVYDGKLLEKSQPDSSDTHVDGILPGTKKKKKKGLKDMSLVGKFVDSVHKMMDRYGEASPEKVICHIDDSTVEKICKVGIYDPATGEIRPHTVDSTDKYESTSTNHTDYREDGTEESGSHESKSSFTRNVIIKGIDKREWIIYGEVMVPTAKGELIEGQFVGTVEKTDAHDHFTTEEEIRKAMIGFMEAIHYSNSHPHNIQHDNSQPDPDTIIIENFLAPTNFMLGGELIVKGTWVMGTKINAPHLRKAIEDGDIKGYSIEGKGILTKIA